MAITKASGNGISSNSLTMLGDSGATANYLDSDLAPGLKHRMADYKELEQPHKVITAGNHILEGVATGTIKGTVIDKDGNQHHVELAGIVVPGLGRHLFSVTAAADTGAVTTFDDKPRLEMGGITLPLQLDDDKVLYSFTLDLGIATTGTTLLAKSDLWHRCLAHVNARSLEVLRKADGNGVSYDEEVSTCDVCAIGKSTKRPHPKTAEYNVNAPYQLVFTDLMGPITKHLEVIITSASSPINTASGRKSTCSRPKAMFSPRLCCFSRRSYSRAEAVFSAFERTKAENTPETIIRPTVSRQVFGTKSLPPTTASK